MKLISGTSNRSLGEAIASYLKTPLVQTIVRRFEDREVFVEVQESIRGQDIFVIQPTSSPANDTLMELLVMIDALKRGSAKSITAVIPYYGYGRQDRKILPRSPVSAKLVANLLMIAGANRVLTIDWHSNQIEGFFDIPTDNLSLSHLFGQHIQTRYPEKSMVIVSPDAGGVVRARKVAESLGTDMAIIDKRRSKTEKSILMNLIGNVTGRSCILIDDIADSAETICKAAWTLKAAGALTIDAYVSHGVLSGNALEKIDESPLSHLFISDTIDPSFAVLKAPKIEILTVASLLGEAIQRIVSNQSISASNQTENRKVNRSK